MSNPLESFESFSKRAAGRRRYNRHRQFLAEMRLNKVIELLWETGPSAHGYQSIIARKLGISRSTICRDLTRLKREYRKGREVTERYRTEERLKRRVRAEDKWLEELLEADASATSGIDACLRFDNVGNPESYAACQNGGRRRFREVVAPRRGIIDRQGCFKRRRPSRKRSQMHCCGIAQIRLRLLSEQNRTVR